MVGTSGCIAGAGSLLRPGRRILPLGVAQGQGRHRVTSVATKQPLTRRTNDSIESPSAGRSRTPRGVGAHSRRWNMTVQVGNVALQIGSVAPDFEAETTEGR